ncbi:hypothetical protein IPZ58_09540 [Streptomyces roseoverticillatus]|uniref:hypothetical protein n=1 Tax=Streptomyces roseoverticillatus TaxID=66429 RepID=UPI001F40CC2B|nr:hypothetical protein [Streptomyces roseoverticillatus]MCF3101824.1 hypothetical protein [Streptomyces roseoverticillatus]
MPGLILHFGASVMCAHPPGTVTLPAPVQQKVLAGMQPVATSLDTWLVAGCALAPTGNPFCTTVQWQQFSTKVFVQGQPVVLQPSPPPGIGAGTGVPAPGPPTVQVMQVKVRGV